MVLRFVAFQHATYLKYPGRMKSFLNQFMEDSKSIGASKLVEYREAFERAADLAFTVFGDRAFRRYSEGNKDGAGGWEPAVNIAVFDAIMWAFSRFEKRRVVPVKDAIRAGLIGLMTSDKRFQDSVTLATADQPKVEYRMKACEAAVREAVELDEPRARLFSYSFKRELFDRNPCCEICGQGIEHLDDAEVDHIEEYAKGGKTAPENARLAHRYCNRARRKR